MAVIEVRDLSKHFGPVQAVDGLSFDADAGTVTGFLGPNGAGKTTTLRILLGLVHASAGAATIHGRPYRALENPLRQVGASLEASAFYPGRSGRNHLRVLTRSAGLPETRVDDVLALTGMSEAAGRRVGGYSLGMRQRLALAAALLGDPGVLVLDEPANGLDPEGIRWLRGFLRSLAAEGRTVLTSSHVLAEVAQTVDRCVIITHGRLVAEAPVDGLTARLAPSVRVRSPDAERLAALLLDAGATVEADGDHRLSVRGVTPERIGELAAAHGIVLHELAASTSLEDAFMELTGGAGS